MSQVDAPDTFNLAGQVALVTGAAQGNGYAIARRLAACGAAIAVNDLRLDGAEKVADEIRASGGRAVALAADVSVVAEIDHLVERTVAELGQLDILVNNAGLIRANLFGSVTEEDWDKTMAVNARGLLFCMQAAARVMIPRGSGRIVNIASIAGRGGQSYSPPYAASKAAVISLTHQAARAVAKNGITVNAVCPGIINTDFNWRLDEELGVKQQGLAKGELLRRRVEIVPLGRIGTPEDVANIVAFLCSSSASYMTGQSVTVDGGIIVS